MGTIVEQEKKLFEEWRQNGCFQDGKRNFVIDGVVDEQEFMRQTYRFVFILKEANQMGETPLPVFLRDGAPRNGGHTWNPVCRWLTGENRTFSLSERAKILKRIAVVNLKKEDGGSFTDMKALEQVVARDRSFIKRQLDIYAAVAPVVFVCCGPGLLSMLNEFIFGNIELLRVQSLVYAKPDARDVYFVAFKHPNCKIAEMTNRFKEILSLVDSSRNGHA